MTKSDIKETTGVRILNHDELPSEAEAQVQLLHGSVGWGPIDFGRIRKARELGYPTPSYFGVYAVEDGQVMSAVWVLRLPFTDAEGAGTVGGIQGVVTRRDQSRRGLARMLLQEVHRREKASGCKHVMLWTGRGMVAHGLYESLGYQDVYTPELAVKACDRAQRPTKYELRKVGESEAGILEKLHHEATSGRLGFTRGLKE